MSCDNVITVQDLETDKKHSTFYREVITGKAGGTGADIDSATNPVTGQTQTTLPKVLSNVGFSPAGFDFTTGGTLTERDKAIFYQADGNWYSWGGTLPKVVPPASSPASTGGIADNAWNVSTSAFMYRDWEGFTAELLAQAGIVDDGQPDEIGNSKRVDAILEITKSHSRLANVTNPNSHPASAISRGDSDVDADLLRLERRGVTFVQSIAARSYKAPTQGQGVVNLGDSISHGAYSGNAYTNHWTYLLAKSVNQQFGSKNLGVIPMDAVYTANSANLTEMIHNVTWAGNWGVRSTNPSPYDYPLGKQASAGADAINGKLCASTEVGASITIVVPSLQKLATIYYTQQVGGGTFNITVNGIAQPDLNTSGPATVYNKAHNINISDSGSGYITIVLTKADSNSTEINAVVGYGNARPSASDQLKWMNFCNYSQSGRQLRHMSESAIIKATNCACLIMSLGYNDSAISETDDAYYAEFVQRINWLVQYVNINRTPLVVQDFCWYWPQEARVRSQLKRLADETGGLYLDYPSRFYTTGKIPTLPPSGSSELVTPLGLFADNAHPNANGNEMIFQTIATAMGLDVTSKSGALLGDLPFPLQLAAGFKNPAGNISTVARTCGGGLLLKAAITTESGGPLPTALTALTVNLNPKFGFTGNVHQQTELMSITGASIATYAIINGNCIFNFAQTAAVTSLRHSVLLSE